MRADSTSGIDANAAIRAWALAAYSCWVHPSADRAGSRRLEIALADMNHIAAGYSVSLPEVSL